MIFRAFTLLTISYTLSGCVITSLDEVAQRQFTNQYLDLRTDNSQPTSVIVRESESLYKELNDSQKANYQYDIENSPYARTKVKGVVINGDSSYPFEIEYRIETQTSYIHGYQRFDKFSNQDRILLNSGPVFVHTYCSHVNARRISDWPITQEGTAFAVLEPNKCYQAITKLDKPHMGHEIVIANGALSETIYEDEIDWWGQCFYETVLEEVPCESINEQQNNG
ncbi:hypothetical protein [Vibrio sp. 1180_3]|uniref:hypothetical protein n=1 Tax=Vibrio sp. 1180_3 TaxID=2528832 RepID=UPI002405F3FF|nr:hypothetical protein [Vibrio sp. 1180_3]MDF9399062.1 hypothetical protein [Vibrio sp. 1180_3]